MNNLPETSHLSNKEFTAQMRIKHWDRIKEALKFLKLATGEQISIEAKMDYHAVVRRLSEMERLEMIYKPGGKIPTKTGRLAYQYSLRSPDTIIPTPEKYNPENDKAHEYIGGLIEKGESAKKYKESLLDKPLVQNTLFDAGSL